MRLICALKASFSAAQLANWVILISWVILLSYFFPCWSVNNLLTKPIDLDFVSVYNNVKKSVPKISFFSTEAHVPTLRYGQYLTHAHNHISPAVTAVDSCFVLIRNHQHDMRTAPGERCQLQLRNSCLWLPLPWWYPCSRNKVVRLR